MLCFQWTSPVKVLAISTCVQLSTDEAVPLYVDPDVRQTGAPVKRSSMMPMTMK